VPADGTTYNGGLGSYNVSWTRANGGFGFVGIKFDANFNNFNNGAQDVFSIVVTGFDPNTAIQVEAFDGPSRGTFSFLLSQTTCSSASAGRFPDWLGGSLSGLLTHFVMLPTSKPEQPHNRTTTPAMESDYDMLRFPEAAMNWNFAIEASVSGCRLRSNQS